MIKIFQHLFATAGVTRTGQGGAHIEVDARAASNALKILTNFVADRSVPNRQIAIQLYQWVQQNFDRGGQMQIPPWLPLKPSTLEQKARHGYSSQPLIRTGNLRQSYLPYSDDEIAGVGARASFGVDYAEVHQEGSADGRIPQRDMLPPREYALDASVRIYGLYLENARHQAGF